MSLSRLHRWYQLASPETKREGRLWYPVARAHVARLGKGHSVSYRTAAGVVATLSPNTTWEQNIVDADNLLYAVRHAEALADFHELKVTTYNANKLKAWNYAETGDVGQIRGPKVTAFYYNLLGCDGALTLDSHAMNAYHGRRVYGAKLKTKPYKAEREDIERAYRRIAELNGESPASVQAIIWLYWKQRIDAGMVPGY